MGGPGAVVGELGGGCDDGAGIDGAGGSEDSAGPGVNADADLDDAVGGIVIAVFVAGEHGRAADGEEAERRCGPVAEADGGGFAWCEVDGDGIGVGGADGEADGETAGGGGEVGDGGAGRDDGAGIKRADRRKHCERGSVNQRLDDYRPGDAVVGRAFVVSEHRRTAYVQKPDRFRLPGAERKGGVPPGLEQNEDRVVVGGADAEPDRDGFGARALIGDAGHRHNRCT